MQSLLEVCETAGKSVAKWLRWANKFLDVLGGYRMLAGVQKLRNTLRRVWVKFSDRDIHGMVLERTHGTYFRIFGSILECLSIVGEVK